MKKKLTDHNHNKYITTRGFNTSAADVFNVRLAQTNLITKTDFDNTIMFHHGNLKDDLLKVLNHLQHP